VNVVHVIRTLDPRTGGPVSVVRGMALAQAALGHRVTVLYEDAAAQNVEPWGPVVHHNLAGGSGRPQALEEWIEQEGPDAVHLHGVWCQLVRRAARLARARDLPYVVSPHGALGRWSMEQKPWKKRLALAFVYRKLLRRAHALVASNEGELADLGRLGLGRHAALVPHGLAQVDVDLRDTPRAADPTILFLSRLTHMKDPLLLVDAFAILAQVHPSVRLIVAGPDDGLGAAVAARVEHLPAPVRERVSVPGPRFGRQKYDALRSAWVLCLPSRYESFGMVLVEALAQGTPVVCSPECGFPDIERAGAGTVAAREVEALAHALSGYLELERSTAAGERGRAFVLERYLWPNIAQEHLRLYHVGTGPD
jgi:glycosyltransferase involved in cell wall biosynthesis